MSPLQRIPSLNRILLALLLVSCLFSTLALAADTDPRPFVPVQEGYSAQNSSQNGTRDLRGRDLVLPYAPDRLLVQLSGEALEISEIDLSAPKGAEAPGALTGLSSVDALAASAGVRSIERAYAAPANTQLAASLGVDRWLVFHFDATRDMKELAEQFRRDPNVEMVSVDWRAFPAVVPSDPLYPDHWGHNNTAQLPDLDWGGTYGHTLPNTVGTPGFDANAQAAWDAPQGYGSSSVVIAILDSGVDIDHPDLNIVAGYDFGDNDSNPDDNSSNAGHGTACAGVAAAVNNGTGAVGIAAGCGIMACKVANNQGSMYFSAIQNALYWAADNGADVISMSLGAVGLDSDAATDAALQYAYIAGCTIFAASGNENDDLINYPASNQYVVAVGAASPCGDRKRSSSNSAECNPGVYTDPNGYTCDGERWWGSSYGYNTQNDRRAVDILGPTILPTTDIGGSGGYESGDYTPFFNGTSCATPYVAGVAALVRSANPSYTPSQVRAALVDNAIDIVNVESGSGWDRYSGYGMVDAAAAVGGGGGPVAPVADFSGTPTSGDYPLVVSFSDLSTGVPTSWSWTFGDGGTATSQNPGHTYTAAGIYTVSLSVSNSAGSDVETRVGYITVTEPSGGGDWTVISYDDFEGGLGSYTDGGGDMYLYTSGTYAHQGSNAAAIQDNSGVASSFYHTSGRDVSGYADLEVEFWFMAVSMDNTREDFWLQYYDGSSWHTVASWARSTDFDNGVFYNKVVAISSSQYTFPTNAQLRFMCDASGNADDVYIDEIEFRGSGEGTGPTPPAAPSALSAATASSTQIDLSWTDNASDEDGFTVERSLDGSGFTQIAAVGANTTSYSDAGLTAATTYYYRVRAHNVAGNSAYSNTASATTDPGGGGGDWVEITYDDFESGMGSYTDGGGDMVRYTGGAYAHQGSAAADIQDNSGVASSFYHTSGQNVTGYVELEVEFWFMAVSMDNTSEDFWLQYYDGSTWHTVATWARGTDFDNGVFYNEVVTISSSQYAFPTGAKLRFMCDASANRDDVYIDEIEFRGLTAGAAGGDLTLAADLVDKSLPARSFEMSQNYPNPFNPMTTIDFSLPATAQVVVTVHDLRGRRVATLAEGTYAAGVHSVTWRAEEFASGAYFYRIQAGDRIASKRMLLLK